MDERELLEIIEEAAQDGRTELDLSGNGITSVPTELGKLTNLTVFNLSSNQIQSVPKELLNLNIELKDEKGRWGCREGVHR